MSKKSFLLKFIILFIIIDILLGIAFFQYNSRKKPRVIFFDVGQGDAIMLDAPGNIQVLVDGGNGNNILSKLGKYMPFYDKNIELVVATHPDKDHLGGLVEVLKHYNVSKVLQTGIMCSSALCRKRDSLISEKSIPVKYAEFGQNIKIGNSADIYVLYPFNSLRNKEFKKDNDTSIILKINTSSNSYLLTGDAGFKTEDKLIDRNINVKSNTLKVSHHGSKYSTSSEFLLKVKPEKAIISVGKNNYGHPAEKLINRLKNMNSEIFRTDEIGDVVFN